jgi:hypothetical protein
MPSNTTTGHNRVKTNHLIEDISFSKGRVLCICGWRGKISDLQGHQKSSDPLPKQDVENAWKRMYGNRNKSMSTVAVRREVDFLEEITK